MEILNQELLKSKTFKSLIIILKQIYEKKQNSKSVISYQEFRMVIMNFINETMKTLLKNSVPIYDKHGCEIKEMKLSRRGKFNTDNNIITINEDVIEKLYSGKIDEMITLFHELGHFKVKHELKTGMVNIDLIRIVKEFLLLRSNDYHDIEDDSYYCTNYNLFSEEKIVDMNAVTLFIKLLEIANIHISREELQSVNERFNKNKKQYQNFVRDFSDSYYINSNVLDFNIAFDVLIKENPEWLKMPQLSIEYYLDKKGNVKKRTREELIKLLELETDINRRRCIEDLLKNNTYKENSSYIDDINYKKGK